MEPPNSFAPGAVNLDNCAQEPIHIPGSMQGHGALIAVDGRGRVVAYSANAPQLLGVAIALGDDITGMTFDAALRAQQAIGAGLALAEEGDVAPFAEEVEIGGQHFDLVVHAYAGHLIVEFERREVDHDLVASFASKAHQAINRLKSVTAIEPLLQMAVEQVAALTGFARVMAYRFRHDDSGDVVAENCAAGLDPYLGRRYPASDIPAQARRLYVLSTLRIIADVKAEPVALIQPQGSAPLDLSQATLRSVSPIHIEYLKNMGVGASMSVSIVVQGKLWGLIACHHPHAHLVPYSVRMACDVLAQMLAARVTELEAQAAAAHAEHAALLRARLVEGLLHTDDTFASLMEHREALEHALQADGMILIEQSKFFASDAIGAEVANAIVASIDLASPDLVVRDHRSQWPASARAVIGPWVGLLALPFDDETRSAIIALRLEQVETVRWGGAPDKDIAHGPHGPRLTPRGSFDEWRETVRDSAPPWSKEMIAIGSAMIEELHRASARQRRAFEQSRTQLLAMLGHDLRDPLSSIAMAAAVLERGPADPKVTKRISNASNRMSRLISDVLDMSRLQAGIGFQLNRRVSDVAALTRELLHDIQLTHPAVRYEFDISDRLDAEVDSDRIVQALGNLLSNARHHGPAGQPILASLEARHGWVRWTVRNVGEPIPAEVAGDMFKPFKTTSPGNMRNRSGLGLGLYIAQQIAEGHGGRVRYDYAAPHVVFVLEIPSAAALPA